MTQSAGKVATWWQRWRERRARTARANAIATAYAYGGPQAAEWAEKRLAANDALIGFVPPLTTCPHDSEHGVCDACMREYRARVIRPKASDR